MTVNEIFGISNRFAYHFFVLFFRHKVELFAQMFDVTLPFDVGSPKPRMSRHPVAAGTRFRLLKCALSLLQGDMLVRSLSKNLLRERVYQTCQFPPHPITAQLGRSIYFFHKFILYNSTWFRFDVF